MAPWLKGRPELETLNM